MPENRYPGGIRNPPLGRGMVQGHEIADLCRRRGVDYPALDENGELLGPVPR